MLNELNGAQPGNDMFVPEPVKAKARSRFGRANNFYGGGGYDYFDYEDYQEPVTVNFELIRKSYKRALLATHPDKHMHESEEKQLQATERFKALNEAFKKYESEHGR
jgi:DnaJ-class molecular chaperone